MPADVCCSVLTYLLTYALAALWALLQRCFPAEVAARSFELEKIENDPVGLATVSGGGVTLWGEGGGGGARGGHSGGREWVAVFVCMVAWPSMPCRLHVFEPRYRLMIRRVYLSSRLFGVCVCVCRCVGV